jgi:hypothetical protein
MHVRWVPTILALVIAFLLLAFVTPVTFFGVTCYAVGEFSMNAYCLKPPVYWGAWVVAAVLLLLGLRAPTRQPDGTVAPGDGRMTTMIIVIGGAAVVILVLAVAAYWFVYMKPKAPGPETPVTEQTEPPPAAEPPPPAIGPDGLPVVPGGTTPPPAPPPPAPVTPGNPMPVPGQYRWTGQATQNNGATYGVTVVFDETGDAEIEWPDLECYGTLSFMTRTGDAFQYAEQITGARCAPRATVTLTPAENGAALQLLEEVGEARVNATMRPF